MDNKDVSIAATLCEALYKLFDDLDRINKVMPEIAVVKPPKPKILDFDSQKPEMLFWVKEEVLTSIQVIGEELRKYKHVLPNLKIFPGDDDISEFKPSFDELERLCKRFKEQIDEK